MVLRRGGIAVSVVMLVAGVIVSAGPTAQAADSARFQPRTFSATFGASASSYISDGLAFEWDESDAVLQETDASESGALFTVLPRSLHGQSFTVTLSGPAGRPLQDGYYGNAGNYGVPQLEVSGPGRGCDSFTGAYDIRDVSIVRGTIQRLDVVFEASCGDNDQNPQNVGELRINEPADDDVQLSSSGIMWGTTSPGLTTTDVVPLAVRNRTGKSVAVGRPRVVGTDASSFRVVSSTCRGTTLQPGRPCALLLAFVPRSHGPLGSTVIWKIDGVTCRIPLQGIGAVGDTGLVVRAANGTSTTVPTENFSPATSSIGVDGDGASFQRQPTGLVIGAALARDTDQTWTIYLSGDRSRPLSVGTYSPAVRAGGNGDSLDMTGTGAINFACNTSSGAFTIDQIAYGGPEDASITHLRAEAVQQCDGAPTPATAVIEWNYAPVVTAPAAPQRVTITRDGPTTRVTWSHSKGRHIAYSVVEVHDARGAAASANSGVALYRGPSTTVHTRALLAGHRYTVSVLDVDAYGNISAARSVSL